MNNLMLLAEGIDVMPLVLAVKSRPELWSENTIRQDFPESPHHQTQTILLRFNHFSAPEDALDEHESLDFPAYAKLPQARPLVNGLMARVAGERLGRVMIVRLPAGCKVDPHSDSGSHAAYYDRFHIVLESHEGNMFRVGDETVHMQTGQVWWFQNAIEHEAVNDSQHDRLHLIIDIRTPRP